MAFSRTLPKIQGLFKTVRTHVMLLAKKVINRAESVQWFPCLSPFTRICFEQVHWCI